MPEKRMRLVGGERVIARDDGLDAVVAFYGNLFARLPKEVKHTGDLTRYVAYQSRVGANDVLHFLGIQVARIEAIPPDMVAWELADRKRTVWESRNGHDVRCSQDDLEWRWLDRSGARITGEFAIGGREYWSSANSYVSPRETYAGGDEVRLVDYDPSWPEQFLAMATWLRENLGPDVVLRIEHYGSTAIPGMPAKPIIDVLVEVPSFAAAKRRAVSLLNRPEWEYWWYSGHMVFIKRAKLMGERTHHIHMAPRGHEVWQGILFRDYLRSHPDEAARYAALRRELAVAHREDRERYTQAKTAFVKEIVSKAGGSA